MKMTPEQLELLKLIKQQPSISLPDLVDRARSRRIYEKPGEDISAIRHDTYRKKISRALDKLADITDPQIPLTKTEGKPTSYSLPKDYKLPAQSLDITLAMFLKMSQAIFEPALPAEHKALLNEYYVESDKRIHGNHLSNQYSRFIEKLAWHPEGYGNRLVKHSKNYVRPNVIEVIAEALFEDRQLRVSYESRYNSASSSQVYIPRGLVLRGHILYLVVQLRDSVANYRHLHLGRIVTVEKLAEANPKHQDFNLKDYIAGGAFEKDHDKSYEPQSVKLWIEPYLKDLFLERVPGVSFSGDDENNIYISFTEIIYPEFVWWLLGFGSGLVVLEPPELVDTMKAEIANLYEHYNN